MLCFARYWVAKYIGFESDICKHTEITAIRC